jgi:hypothetical protein
MRPIRAYVCQRTAVSDYFVNVLSSVVAALGAGALAIVLTRFTGRAFKRDVDAERERLMTEVLGDAVDVAEVAPVGGERERTPGGGVAQPPQPETDRSFATLLVEYYAYGLSQARRSFILSLTASLLGGLIIMAGVAMAIVNSQTSGDLYAGILASVVGLLTGSIGTLFHRRADAALKHMEAQTRALREDMKVERDAGHAVRLLENVGDPNLKAHLQAALILKFSAAKLPSLNAVIKSTTSLSPQSDGTEPASPTP